MGLGGIKSVKYFFIGFLLLFNSIIGLCINKTDSLKSLLQNAQNDSILYTIQYELADELLLNNHTEALHYYTLSKNLSVKYQDSTHIVYNLLGISDIYSMMGEYKKALNIIQEAMMYAGNEYDLLASCHSRLSIEYDLMGKTNLSIINDRLSLKYNKLLGDSLKIAYDLHNIGSYYIAINNADSAIYYYNLSNTFIKSDIDILHAYNNSRLAIAYSDKKEYHKALLYHNKALKAFTQDSLLYDMALEEYYAALSLYKQNNEARAIKHLNNSLNYASKLNNHDLFRTNYQLLYKIYNSQKDYKSALKYALLNQAYSDSLEKKNQENIIKNLKTQHKLLQQDEIIEATQHSNTLLSKQKKILTALTIIASSLMLISILVLILINRAWKRNKILTQKLNTANNSKQKILSIIGHDLKDSVGNLKNFTQLIQHNLINNKSITSLINKYIPMVNSTYNLLETLLVWSKSGDDNLISNPEKTSISEIISKTTDHLSHLASTKNITLNSIVESSIFYADKNMILTVLRNFVSNAIKFSHPHSTVDIIAKKISNNIIFTVRDYGVGMTQEQIDIVLKERIGKYSVGTMGEQGSGLGLALCNTLIKKHHGKISIDSIPNKGSSFVFEVPVSQKADSN